MALSGAASSIKHFSGQSGEDLEVFVEKYKVVAQLQGWTTKAKRAEHLPLFLEKGAFTVWSQLSPSIKKDDEEIFVALRSSFGEATNRWRFISLICSGC